MHINKPHIKTKTIKTLKIISTLKEGFNLDVTWLISYYIVKIISYLIVVKLFFSRNSILMWFFTPELKRITDRLSLRNSYQLKLIIKEKII